MSKKVKGLIENDLMKRLEGVSEFLVISLRGISGVDNNNLRGELQKQDISVLVVKNSLAARALAKLGIEGAGSLFKGPCAIAFGADSAVDVAKAVVDWSKKIDKLEIKGAFLDGQALDTAGAVALSKMPNRVELQGMVVELAMSPGRRVASAVTSPAGRIAGCIKTLIENLEAA